ncbi:ABC transporter ATP-binding protein [Actinoalloteichus hymeniacidonis]|uniref:ABC-type multidrug transport system, ATPase component n=1 Tax=Actinoalloteichus hymeniacidonis TaxID=340345 RepID=A0AAC9HMQ9_9PSEU|nr:ABC transporter ATP-binding protein [Actinoalloteichus hymeniacidonis]AOS61974.1 ABC-type multidrug transport system, ATPase component [Actinoalloteichus hymeniacidonis]MBB5910004.1 ABC-2 type transport system ATP-binding protein [Actinoalloteichus hymeniacidonis]
MTLTLECEGLVKRYGDNVAVDNVGFKIEAGQSYGLLGPNGAGKSTTVSMLVGLLRPDAGTVRICGADLASDPMKAKAHIGYVPQEIALFPELTGRENLRYFGRLYGLSRRDLRRRIDEVLELVTLSDRADEKISGYSGGMKRRINIGAALLHEPKILVLDEPTVGVDPQSRKAILDGVEELVNQGMSLLYISHYMEEVERISELVGVIDRGKLVAEGTRKELVSRLGTADRVELVLDGDVTAAAEKLRAVAGVTEAVVVDTSMVRLVAKDGRHLLPALIGAVEGAAAVTGVEVVEPDLEAAFLHLTGSKLRD